MSIVSHQCDIKKLDFVKERKELAEDVKKLKSDIQNYGDKLNNFGEELKEVGKTLSDVKEYIKKKDEEPVFLDNIVTVNDLNDVVEDVQKNLDFMMNSTPREINILKNEIIDLKAEIESIKKVKAVEVIDDKKELKELHRDPSRNMPKLSLTKRK